MIQAINKKKIDLNILYYFYNVYNGCYKHKGRVMNINKVEWVDILGNPIGSTEERYEKLAKQIEEYNKKKAGK